MRLVTLTGPGGIGKTRLAIAVGERLDATATPRGTVFVPLASIARARAGAASHRRRGGRDHRGRAAGRWTSWSSTSRTTPTLLVLDNLEQVVGVAPELDQLLARCPGLQILATSRTVLRLRAEREYPVGALDGAGVLGAAADGRGGRRCRPCSCSSIGPRPSATTSP